MFQDKISVNEINNLELCSFKGEIVVIDSFNDDYYESIDYLKSQRCLGFDTETKPDFLPGRSQHKVALLQLSSAKRAYLYRLNDIDLPKEIVDILADEKIVKVGVAVKGDIVGLQKSMKFKAKSFVDLQLMVKDYGILDMSLKKMAAIILGVHISKRQQLSNWEAAALSEAQLSYAATDAWICREMYCKLLDSRKLSSVSLDSSATIDSLSSVESKKDRVKAKKGSVKVKKTKPKRQKYEKPKSVKAESEKQKSKKLSKTKENTEKQGKKKASSGSGQGERQVPTNKA